LLKFTLKHSHINSKARAGLLETAHGSVETPVFMPVGTQATVKTLSPRDLTEVQSQIILANTIIFTCAPDTKEYQHMEAFINLCPGINPY